MTNNGDSSSSSAAGSKQPSRFSRSKSIGVSGNNASNGRMNSQDAGKDANISSSSSGLITSSSRHQYMQKRKVLMKFGTRGSEAGSFTWPRGVAVGPDNSIVVNFQKFLKIKKKADRIFLQQLLTI